MSFGQNEIMKLSRGEICVANFIPPANGVSQGSYLVKYGLLCQKGYKQAYKITLAAKLAKLS